MAADVPAEPRDLGHSIPIPDIEDIGIVVVDDDRTTLTFLGSALERLGYPVRSFSSSVKALADIEADPPHVLVTDVVMPGVGGVSLAEAARGVDPGMEIVFVTGYGDSETAGSALSVTGAESITKPVEPKALASTLLRATLRRAVGEYRRSMVEWMYAELARNEDQVRQVTVGTLTALINALDARSPHFRGHSKAVALQAAAIAQRLGLDDDTVESIRTAGLLHDIGMVGVPDDIIQKPDALTSDELAVVRAHCEAGSAIIEPMSHLANARLFILEHHERWDGSGYPGGKRGEEISLGGQVVGIAEAWTAILESRAYRAGRSREQGLEILQEHRDEWFSGEITDALIESDVGLLG